jgi:hypothetical protein
MRLISDAKIPCQHFECFDGFEFEHVLGSFVAGFLVGSKALGRRVGVPFCMDQVAELAL